MSTTRVFGYTDIHWSDRDPKALAVAEAAQRAFKPHRVVIGGDLLNCGPFSRHPKTKLDEDDGYDLLDTELKPAAKFLDRVEKHTSRIDMLEGNHDEWLERWLRNVDGANAFKSLLPSRFLAANRTKPFTYIPFTKLDHGRQGKLHLHPKLIVVHGWAANKYAADRHLQLAKPYSIVYHHTHRIESRIAPMLDGSLTGAWCAGCLCKKVPIYAYGGSPTEWGHGFWVAYVGVRSFTLYTIPIFEKGFCILPDGREVRQ